MTRGKGSKKEIRKDTTVSAEALFDEAYKQPEYEPIQAAKQAIYSSTILSAFTQNLANGQIRYMWLDKQTASDMRVQVNRTMSAMIAPTDLLIVNDKRIDNQAAMLNMQIIYRQHYSTAPKFTPPVFANKSTACFLEKCTADELSAFCQVKGFSLKDLQDYNEFYPEELANDFREFLSWNRDNELNKKISK